MIASMERHRYPERDYEYTVPWPHGIEDEESRHEQLQAKYAGTSNTAHQSVFRESKVKSEATTYIQIMVQSLASELRATTTIHIVTIMSVFENSDDSRYNTIPINALID